VSELRPLRERKQQRVRETIVEAAFELFAERGFAEVTVADIAERAEVGRTTFFRYFGDKQEVVFADEQQMLDDLLARFPMVEAAQPPDLARALAQIRVAVAALCDVGTRDAERYVRHERLLQQHPELHDRGLRKLGRFTEAASEFLRAQGATELVASLAPQLALACYQAGRRVAGTDPDALTDAVQNAFDELMDLSGAQ
jgi:AcrR family transcriptional regulator